MRTSARIVAVLLFDEVELLDVAGVVSVLAAAGRQWNYRPFKLVTAAKEARIVETRSQLRLEAAQSLDACDAAEIVVVPGGYGARRALEDDQVVAWLARVGTAAEHIIAVGHGTLLVAKAGLADGADLAVSPETRALLANTTASTGGDSEAPWREGPKIFSAATPSAGALAALGLVKKLLGDKQARIVADALGLPNPAVEIEIRGAG